ncbi:MAG: hypothetical protein AB7S26_22245 [Sandaracinaceae bacterium]
MGRAFGAARIVVVRRILLALAFALFAASVAPRAIAQTRGIPAAVRRALVGCWVPWPGERWTIRPHGATWLVVEHHYRLEALRSTFPGARALPQGPPETMDWVERADASRLGCGPMSRHGRFCAVRPNEDGTLSVDVYARAYRRDLPPRFAFHAVAHACH